jgi:hypothetical protein
VPDKIAFDPDETMERLFAHIIQQSSDVQRATALRILKRYVKQTFPTDASMQTEFSSFDAMVKHFNEQIQMLMLQVESADRKLQAKEKEMKALNVTTITLRNELS